MLYLLCNQAYSLQADRELEKMEQEQREERDLIIAQLSGLFDEDLSDEEVVTLRGRWCDIQEKLGEFGPPQQEKCLVCHDIVSDDDKKNIIKPACCGALMHYSCFKKCPECPQCRPSATAQDAAARADDARLGPSRRLWPHAGFDISLRQNPPEGTIQCDDCGAVGTVDGAEDLQCRHCGECSYCGGTGHHERGCSCDQEGGWGQQVGGAAGPQVRPHPNPPPPSLLRLSDLCFLCVSG